MAGRAGDRPRCHPAHVLWAGFFGRRQTHACRPGRWAVRGRARRVWTEKGSDADLGKNDGIFLALAEPRRTRPSVSAQLQTHSFSRQLCLNKDCFSRSPWTVSLGEGGL